MGGIESARSARTRIHVRALARYRLHREATPIEPRVSLLLISAIGIMRKVHHAAGIPAATAMISLACPTDVAAVKAKLEARTWALEATIQIPVSAEIDHRPEVELAVGLDLRFVF